VDPKKLTTYQKVHGYTSEKLDMLVFTMAKTHHEPLGSMGADVPLACLSKLPRSPYDYFYQLFAQATNPAIDPLRESNVMSLRCNIGPEGNLLATDKGACSRLILEEPVLSPAEFTTLTEVDDSALEKFPVAVIDITYERADDADFEDMKAGLGKRSVNWRARAFKAIKQKTELEERLDQVCAESEAAVRNEKVAILVLSQRNAGEKRVPINSLLVVGAVHHHLIQTKLRARVAIIVESGDAYEIHHFCTLLGFGADAIYPYLVFASLMQVKKAPPLKQMISNFREGCHAGILKVMSKMGISCLHSYKGAQLFQSIGLGTQVVQKCFKGMDNAIEGLHFDMFHDDALRLHRYAYPLRALPPLVDGVESLPDWGDYHFRSAAETELHVNTPDTIASLQLASRERDSALSDDAYEKFASYHNKVVEQSEIRGQFEFCFDMCDPIPLEEVESEREIMKRFSTGAMSLGSLSMEAHTTLALAMNSIGGRSNTGEGGEAEERYNSPAESKIKQVASGRFGVTSKYLSSAEEIQIKLAQGAKPGEGGELPGFKVVGIIATTRKSTPGVGLISPPPHHDMYSIEDVAQLIADLKHSNPKAEISIKLVSRIGVGVIAAGVL
jgi:glutamate synthase (NADPH/NADH)